MGITFDNDRDSLFKLNYTPKLSRLKSLLNLWSIRDLTPIGRITIVKTLGLSQFVFLFQVLPDPPNSLLKEIETHIFRFIWAGKPDKVKRNTLIGCVEQGGLRAIHIKSFIQSLKCTWVKRFTNAVYAEWKFFFNLHLKKYGSDYLFKCNFQIKDIIVRNTFINDVCSAWSAYNFRKPDKNFKNEIIWNNSLIKVDNNIIFYSFMYERGVERISDFLDDKNCLLSLSNFKQKFSLQSLPFIIVYSIFSAIPRHWKDDFGNVYNSDDVPDKLQNLQDIPFPSRYVYNVLIESIFSAPTAINKWKSAFVFSEEEWRIIFRSPFASCSESKICYFQFRFVHKILGTNYYLSILNQNENPRCTFCGTHDEKIEHLFWECRITSNFILDTEYHILGRQFVFKKQDIFFGYQLSLRHPYNFLILHLKYFLFNKKLNNELPSATEFLNKFKFILQVEKSLSDQKRRKIPFCTLFKAFENCTFLFAEN